MTKFSLKKLGPGLLFAGAAIGVSHLVQSTRAGADFGLGLLWALLLINAIKYPFFEFGPRYATATGQSIIHGYKKQGKWVLAIYFLLTLATMFTIQTAVTIVAASIASSLFDLTTNTVIWSIIITGLCFILLLIGKYRALDKVMKVIIISLAISTILAVILAIPKSEVLSLQQIIPSNAGSIAFLIAFMGWMPAPLDISIWHSVWTVEKNKTTTITQKQSKFDFNLGYITTIILGIGFLSLGALVMFNSGESFASGGSQFASQLIGMYTENLGENTKIIIGLAAFTTMLSTTITTLDGSPRVMHKSSQLLTGKKYKHGYLFWLIVLMIGTIGILLFFISEMGMLVKIATILSFLTAPFYAIFNYRAIFSKDIPKEAQPSQFMRYYSVMSIILLIGFSVWYLTTL